MKLYDVQAAPNPRRVRMFLAEKGVTVPLEPVDMMAGQQRTPEYLAMNPSGKIPVLQLDDGTCIAESVAICRYFEGVHPEPNLFGATPTELGVVEMNNRIIELELLSQVGVSWVNGPVVAKVAAGRFTQIPAAKEQSDERVHRFYKRLDRELGEREYIAGERFTVADITAVVTIDFATNLVDLKPKPELANLWRWHAGIASRSSYEA